MSANIDTKALQAVALSVRTLTMDAIQKAKSGHPGLPMGCAELGALLYGYILNHNPKAPHWLNRDRFILSAGHGSMLLYSLLHLSGYDLSLEDLKNFRQLNSRTPGHPENFITSGVETTTGPLGQGLANAVGMAIAEKWLSSQFNTEEHAIFNHNTYILAGDGCIMEGISSEAASLAGHLGLGKLIVFYDSNRITIEGTTDLAFTEDVVKRFESYNWHVLEGDAYNLEEISSLVEKAKNVTDKPSFIKLNSTIAMGSVNLAGSEKSHGAPLGDDEIKASKKNMGVDPEAQFYVDSGAVNFFEKQQAVFDANLRKWNDLYEQWGKKNPELLEKLENYLKGDISSINVDYDMFSVGDKLATRAAGGKVLNQLAGKMGNLMGGSSDLGPSNVSTIKEASSFQKEVPAGRVLHFGVREHAMGGILNGMALYGGIRPFGATFLVFADYMRPSMRLAALMKLPVIYILTHDSIFVGEDGPTHQPIEHAASLRIIPGLSVLRPADAQETAAAWQMALENTKQPTALLLTRQGIEVFEKSDNDWKNNIKKGAYVAKDCEGKPEIVIIATGSEVSLSLEAAAQAGDKKIRIVSMISRERFMALSKEDRENIIPSGTKRLVVEAGVSYGWEGLAGEDGKIISIDRFGASGPGAQVAEYLGFSVANVLETLNSL